VQGGCAPERESSLTGYLRSVALPADDAARSMS
jgi:hypothetical protein